jgi:hypothetical protein
MKKSDRFNNMDEVRTEKARLRAAREGYRYNMKEHWTVLGEKEFRRGLVGDFVGELMSGWKPMKSVMAFLDEKPQALTNIASSMLGANKGTLWGKAIMWGLTAASPYLTDKIGGNKSADSVLGEVRRSWERLRDYVRSRRARHNGNDIHEPHDVYNGHPR